MYAVSIMAALTTKQPKKVQKMALRVWQYLAGSLKDGLIFTGDPNKDITTYTDASFGENDAHGCVVVKWGEDPILWRSSRQNLQSTSTAEAELIEIMEGAIATEAGKVMIEEVMDQRARCWQLTDSSAALAIITGDTASWRTRHLRRRARFLRVKVGKGEIIMRHLPGTEMVADLGTKSLPANKFLELRRKLGMLGVEDKKDHNDHKKPPPSQAPVRPDGGRMQLAILMALVAKTKAEEEDEEMKEWNWLVMIYTIAVVLLTLALQWLWKKWNDPRVEPRTTEMVGRVVPSMPRIEPCTTRSVGHVVSSMPEARPEGVPPMPSEESPAEADDISWMTEEEPPLQTETSRAPQLEDPQQAPLPRQGVSGGSASASNDGREASRLESVRVNRLRESDDQSGILVAGSGACYHCKRDCTGVKLSKNVWEVRFCQICLERYNPWKRGSTILYTVGLDCPAHTSVDHFQQVWPDTKPRKFRPCQVCMSGSGS